MADDRSERTGGTYLVTGAAGFVGSHVCDRLLAEGKRVVGVDDLSTGRIANLVEARSYGQRFSFHNLDIRSPDLRTLLERHRPEVVMHLAAQASVAASVADPVRDASVNVVGTVNLLEAAVATGVRKIVYAASGGTLYGEPRSLPIKESSRRGARLASPYGVSKAAPLDYLAFFHRSRGLDWTALALANVYGPRQDPSGEAGVVSIFGAAMLNGEPPVIFGDGEQTRDYIYVDDTVDAFARAADAGSGLLLNVGTGLETNVKQLYQILARLTRFRGQPIFGPPREGDLRRNAVDPKRASQEIGWRPWTTLEEGLGETVEWLRDQ